MLLSYIAFSITLYGSILFSTHHSLDRKNPYFYEIITRIYSSIHAFTSFSLAVMYLLSLNMNIYSLLFANSLIYVITDIMVVYLYRQFIHHDIYLWFHHGLFLTGLSYFTFIDPEYIKICYCLLTEISTPFLNWSWILYKFPNNKSLWVKEEIMAHSSLIITFFLFRVVNLGNLTYSTLYQQFISQSYQISNLVPVGYISSLWILNIYWFSLLIHKFIHY